MANNPMQTPHFPVPLPMQPIINPTPPLDINACQNSQSQLINDDEYLDNMPPGFRFLPRDDELIVNYLCKKINKEELPRNRIHEVKLYESNPDYLAAKYRASGENEWYFFTPREKKYKGGRRPRRDAKDGYWKATGADKVIRRNGQEVGYRKSLLFYSGKPSEGQRTSWLMYEYRVKDPPRPTITDADSMRLDDCVLCKIYKKVSGNRNSGPAINAAEDRVEEVEVQNPNSGVASEQSLPLEEADVPRPFGFSLQYFNIDHSMSFFRPGETSSSWEFQGCPSTPFDYQAAGLIRNDCNHNSPANSFDMLPRMHYEPRNPAHWNSSAPTSSGSGTHQYDLSQIPAGAVQIRRNQSEDAFNQISWPIPTGSQEEDPLHWNPSAWTSGSGTHQSHVNEIPGTTLTWRNQPEDALTQIAGPIPTGSQKEDVTSTQISGPAQGSSLKDGELPDENERCDLDHVMELWNQTPHDWPSPDPHLKFW